jgi:hypothetical protein
VCQEVAGDSSAVLAHCKAVALHRCRLAKFLASSALAVKVLAVEGKSEASAYCLVRSRDGWGGSTIVPVFVRFYLLVQWHDASHTTDRIARACFIETEESNQQGHLDNASFCSHVWRCDPKTGMGPERDRWISVDDIMQPVILIKHKPDLSISKLVQFKGRLCGSHEDTYDASEST